MSNDPFEALEEKTGIRWIWNLLPANKTDSSKLVLPISALHSPLKSLGKLQSLNYHPVTCKTCRTILNPYARVDYNSKTWVCPICLQHNLLPRSYQGITPKKRPAELHPGHTTVEYNLSSSKKGKRQGPFFLYVVDTCLSKDKLEIIKENMLMSLDLLPENSYVGLITFGATVQLYELGYSECSKAYVFRGDKAPTLSEFQEQIGLTSKFTQPQNRTQFIKSKFLVELGKNELNITNILEEISPDPWPVMRNKRDRRCTGIALSIATSLTETGFVNQGGHIITFVGGPCTSGEGKIIGLDKSEHLRLHNDIQSDTAKYYKSSLKFFQGLSKRVVKNGHVVDLFAANLDQVGLLEMKPCVANSGGVMLLTDEFKNPIFCETFKRFLDTADGENELNIKFNGTLEINCSSSLKICGAIGPLASMNKKTSRVSETEIGFGNTNAWKVNCITSDTTVGVFFEMANTSLQSSSGMPSHQKSGNVQYFQFITSYQNSLGESKLRVTTTALKMVMPKRFDELAKGFDQRAAAVVMARLAIHKAKTDYLYDVLRWLDRSLIRLIRRFGNYTKDQPDSLRLSSMFSLFPQFMFHLRRGHFLRVFNNSPDETCFFRFYLNGGNLKDSMTMIQPHVIKYSFEKPPMATNLDSTVLQRRVILLMDCFDTVLVYYGGQISEWVESGFHKQKKYKSLAKLIKLPEIQAKKIIEKRFPYPTYIVCDEGSSQARIILSKVNPTNTHKNSTYGEKEESVKILTDDSSLGYFMKHLRELVVANT